MYWRSVLQVGTCPEQRREWQECQKNSNHIPFWKRILLWSPPTSYPSLGFLLWIRPPLTSAGSGAGWWHNTWRASMGNAHDYPLMSLPFLPMSSTLSFVKLLFFNWASICLLCHSPPPKLPLLFLYAVLRLYPFSVHKSSSHQLSYPKRFPPQSWAKSWVLFYYQQVLSILFSS